MLEPCPRCGATDVLPEFGPDEPWGLYCATCGWSGPRVAGVADEPDAAIAAWNREVRQIAEARCLGIDWRRPPPDAEEST